MKKAFTLIEIIVVVVIIAIILSAGVYKLFLTNDKANLLQAKTQIALIQQNVLKQYNQEILQGQMASFDAVLDNATANTSGQRLFTKLTSQAIYSTSTQDLEVGRWIKQSDTLYALVLSQEEQVSFKYDSVKGTFECDTTQELCKKLYE